MSISTALLNRLRDLTVARPRPKPLRYGLTVVVIAMVAIVQVVLFGSSAPWFLYTPAVLLLTLFLGRGPGVLATIISALGAGLVVARSDLPLLKPCSQAFTSFEISRPKASGDKSPFKKSTRDECSIHEG
ncbi:DUF4118 domain-containing protein [Sphingomonas aracearum]|uniref:Histidine kinase n=1 Tax=Sphingomonas aracearum TaxID=2283317 RepID=A0A369VRN3_9SPHN|nr:DUF4118 domain-containing protein [Sphingomonas aracearum]RDE04157.1 hypothetical protein DVW87_17215 [Sphingomonas aracearum]